MHGLPQRLRGVRQLLVGLPEVTVARYLRPEWLGYRWIARETVAEYLLRCPDSGRGATRYRTVHPATVERNPLPRNVADPALLPDDAGWWGYSFRDVPARPGAETFIATLPACRVVTGEDEHGDFHVTVLNRDRRALTLREMHFRPAHTRTLRSGAPAVRLARATWFIERVYDNHSHWLTAHLPKLCLLRSLDMLHDLVVPARRNRTIDDSMAMLGLDPRDFAQFDSGRSLDVDELTLLGTDRFRPELLRPVREALAGGASHPQRRIYISRARAARRTLMNEHDIWPLFRRAGFERVFMEDLSFGEQVDLMRETAMLAAPHGAGLTNMMFCPEGCQVVEIADLGFPNPNFYALAAAMGHDYWLVAAESHGSGHPLTRDMSADPTHVATVLRAMLSDGAALR